MLFRIENNIQSLEQETESTIVGRSELQEKIKKIMDSIEALISDTLVKAKLEGNLENVRTQISLTDSEIEEYQTKAANIQCQIEELLCEQLKTNEILEELARSGIDVSEGSKIILDRQYYIEQCQQRLNEVLEKLGLLGSETENLSSINNSLSNSETSQYNTEDNNIQKEVSQGNDTTIPQSQRDDSKNTDTNEDHIALNSKHGQHNFIHLISSKIITVATLIGFIKDLIGAGSTAYKEPNQYNPETTIHTSIVVDNNLYDTRSIYAVLKDFDLENGEWPSSFEDVIIDVGQALSALGSDTDALAEYVYDHLKHTNVDNDILNAKFKSNASPNQELKLIEKQPLDPQITQSFMNSEYISVIANEDLLFYRIYGGGSSRKGNPSNEMIFLSLGLPKDRLYSKTELALSNIYKDNGKTILITPNTRQYYCEVIVPKGATLNIGYIASQKTLGGQDLSGGGVQIVTQKKGLIFGKEKSLGFSEGYKIFDEKAKKIEKCVNDTTE